jgi:hypothetical protein
MHRYYVYKLIDSRTNACFYIGKGKGKRVLQHNKIRKTRIGCALVYEVIADIISSGYKVEYRIIIQNLSEEAAFLLEKLLIYRIGRKVYGEGPLANIAPGGRWQFNDPMFLQPSEIPSEAEIERAFPELLPILIKYPHTAKCTFHYNYQQP